MQIIIDVAWPGDGRLTGTARLADPASESRHFTGVMELVACLEQLYAAASHHRTPSEPDHRTRSQEPPGSAASQQPSTEEINMPDPANTLFKGRE
jgi:hypothetical protein